MTNTTRHQVRKVRHEGHGDHVLHMLRPGEWSLPTPVGMLTFRQFRGHWAPYFGDHELSQWSTTKLDTAVRRVMLRARVAFLVAYGLGSFRRSCRECLGCNEVLSDNRDDCYCLLCVCEHYRADQLDLGGES